MVDNKHLSASGILKGALFFQYITFQLSKATSHCRDFQRKIKIQTLKTHYFTLTHDCRICLPEKAGERCRARLHTTVGCSHGDGRRKYDSKRPSSHAQAYVKLQSFNITLYALYICMCVWLIIII